jgi:hypothetical protein
VKKLDMTIEEKNELNKKIRSYKGDNSFVLSIQKQLKTSKYLTKVDFGNKQIKILSDKQYEAIINALS